MKFKCMVLLLLVSLSFGGCSSKEDGKQSSQEIEKTAEVQTAEKKQVSEVSNPTYIAEGIRKVSIEKAGEEVLLISYEPQDYESSHEYWKIKIPYGGFAIVDTEASLRLFHQLEALDYQSPSEIQDETATGLLESNTSISLEFCQTKEAERSAAISGTTYEKSDSPSYKAYADSKLKLIIGNSNGEGFYYTALESNPKQVCLMPESVIDEVINTDPFGQILKVSASVNVDTVAQVTAYIDDKAYPLKKEEPDTETWRSMYADMLSILVVGEIKDESKRKDVELLRLVFERNTKEAPDVEIIYHEYDEKYASVSVNGVERLLVEKEDVERLQWKFSETVVEGK